MTLPYFDLSGKTAIITGGSKGLGEQMAYALAEAGADVALVSRTRADLDAVSAAIRAATGRSVIGVAADVTKDAEIRAMVQTVMAEFGQIDILIKTPVSRGRLRLHNRGRRWDRFRNLTSGSVLCPSMWGRDAKSKKAIVSMCLPVSKMCALYGRLRGDQGGPGVFYPHPGARMGPG